MSTTHRTEKPTSTSATTEPGARAHRAAPPRSPAPPDPNSAGDWPPLPTETEIYILPGGQVIFADLPAELAALAAELGRIQPCAVEPEEDPG